MFYNDLQKNLNEPPQIPFAVAKKSVQPVHFQHFNSEMPTLRFVVLDSIGLSGDFVVKINHSPMAQTGVRKNGVLNTSFYKV